MAPEADRAAMADLYRRGGFGYGEVKKALVAASAAFFADARARRAELEADPGRIEAILAAGAAKARVKAGEVLGRARRACGLARGEAASAGTKGRP
jgi:tryptophanyl-tRNA synthetase